ncbi:MAG: hypothetical protein QG657_2597 [Acidobacteriota bacterium]|nr:hypothetical protein [Acidobacteriota bacterium]
MDFAKFKETEQQYKDLKEKLSNGEINPEEMKKELKKMMVLDENGYYWMIGGKTGKWYIYNGTEWKEDNPFKEKPQPTAVYTEPAREATDDMESAGAGEDSDVDAGIGTGSGPGLNLRADEGAFTGTGNYAYNDRSGEELLTEYEEPFVLDATGEISPREAATPVRIDEGAGIDTLGNEQDQPERYTICKICKAKISQYAIYCPICGANQKEAAAPSLSSKPDRIVLKENELLIDSIKIGSMFFFVGAIGLIVGVLWGAAFGIFKTHLADFQPLLPNIISSTRGGIAGGLIFAAFWGIVGFVISASFGAVLSIIYNIIAFIFGGIRFKIKQ